MSDYQDQAIQDYNDAAEAKGNDPIPTMEQIDMLRDVLGEVLPRSAHRRLWSRKVRRG